MCCDSLRPNTRFRPSLAGCGPRGIFVWRNRTSWTQCAGNRPVPCPRKTPSRRPQSVAPVTVKNKETKTRLLSKKYFWALPTKQKIERDRSETGCRPKLRNTVFLMVSIMGNIESHGTSSERYYIAVDCEVNGARRERERESTFCWICLVMYLQGCLLD